MCPDLAFLARVLPLEESQQTALLRSLCARGLHLVQVTPFLRGEWNTSKTGLLAPAEQRILLAVDALLGAVPVWFKASSVGHPWPNLEGCLLVCSFCVPVFLPSAIALLPAFSPSVQGPEALQQHLAICEAAQSGNLADMGRALLSVEQLLAGEGRLPEEWLDVWQLPWSRWANSGWLPTACHVQCTCLYVEDSLAMGLPLHLQPSAHSSWPVQCRVQGCLQLRRHSRHASVHCSTAAARASVARPAPTPGAPGDWQALKSTLLASSSLRGMDLAFCNEISIAHCDLCRPSSSMPSRRSARSSFPTRARMWL